MRIFDEIGRPRSAEAWLDEALAEKRKIMGFGHRVYKHGDSRVPTMKAALDTLIEEYDRQDMLDLYDALETAMDARKGIKPNLDYPSGPAYNLMGFDTDHFTPLFVASAGHRLDRAHHGAAGVQRADPPAVEYIGPERAPREGPDLPDRRLRAAAPRPRTRVAIRSSTGAGEPTLMRTVER